MRSLSPLLFFQLSLVPLSLATAGPRGLIFRRDICTDNGEVDCESKCMPPGAVCCNDGSSTYCPAGNNCIPNGCCPKGSTCSGGGGGTITNDILTGTGTFPVGGKTTSAAVVVATTKSTTPIFTQAATTPVTKSTTNTPVFASTSSSTGAQSSLAVGAAPGGQLFNSEAYAMAFVAMGQFILM
jgi:hypothetical protein